MLWPYKQKLEDLLELLGTIDGKTPWGTVLDDVVAFLGADRGTLYQVDAEQGELWSTALSGGVDLEIRLKIGKGLAGWVAMGGVPLVINDVLKDDRFDGRWDQKSGYHTHTVLGVPLKSPDGKVRGVLQLLNKPDGFDDVDVQIAVVIAHVCALALEIARLRG